MSLKSAALKLTASATVAPPYTDNLTGSITLSQALEPSQAAATNALQFRAYFGAAGQTATVDLTDGTITLSATGTRQVETCTVTAASGATSSGDLALTLTSALVTGSPLAITVPLSTTAHTTATLIAAAIVAKLKTLSAVTDHYTITQNGAAVILTTIFAAANDTTLNLAITAGLGVSAVTSSTNTTAGVAGVVIERVGGDGEDVHGVAMTNISYLTQFIVSNTASSASNVAVADGGTGSFVTPGLSPGGFLAMAFSSPVRLFSASGDFPIMTAAGKCIVDFGAVGSAS